MVVVVVMVIVVMEDLTFFDFFVLLCVSFVFLLLFGCVGC